MRQSGNVRITSPCDWEKGERISGDLGESWIEVLDCDSHISRDYNHNPSQKLGYLHNFLHIDAKRYYLDKVDGIASGFQQAVARNIISTHFACLLTSRKGCSYLLHSPRSTSQSPNCLVKPLNDTKGKPTKSSFFSMLLSVCRGLMNLWYQ